MKRAAIAVSAAGALLWGLICFVKADGPLGFFQIGLFVWGCVPYFFCLFVTLAWKSRPHWGLFGAAAALAGDSLTYFGVFVDPGSSTSALGLLTAPLLNLLVLVPGGMALGSLVKWMARRSVAP